MAWRRHWPRQVLVKTPSKRRQIALSRLDGAIHPGLQKTGRSAWANRLLVRDFQRALEQLRIAAHTTGELHLNDVFAGNDLGPTEKPDGMR